MADSRRSSLGKKNATSVGPQPASDWSPSSEPRTIPSPRTKRHGGDIDVDMDIVESSDDDSDDVKASTPQRKRQQPAARRPARVQVQRRPPPVPTDSETDTPPTPLKGRRRSERSPASMRAPNASVPVVGKVPKPHPIYEEDDDDEPPSRSARPSRPSSRQTVARHDLSSRSGGHRYRSTTTPESRRSPRTSVSDSDEDTEATSDEEMVIQPPRKQFPRVPMAPAVPAPPPASAMDPMYERLNRRPEIEYESPDPEPDTASRYTQSMARPRSRSQSRAPSSKWDQYRRPRDVDISRPASPEDDRARSKSRSRSKSRRPSTRQYDSDYNSRPPALIKRANTTAGDSHFASSRSLGSGRSAFYPDFPGSSVHPAQLEKPAKRLTTCVSCKNDRMLVERTIKLQCAHRMCQDCVRKNFARSMTSPEAMPPRCCSSNALIPFKKVEDLFDPQFKEAWKRKWREYSQALSNQIYCPSEGCGAVVRPESSRHKGGRSHARCTACSTKICCDCHGPWHRQTECPRDEPDAHVMAQPRLEGWQRCFRCGATEDLKDASNHVKCRCGAEFCGMCGNRWKACPCPMYRSGPTEALRTERVRITMNPRPNPFGSGPQHPSKPPSPRGYPPAFAPSQAPVARTRPPLGRPSSYEEEAHLHRMYEQREEHHARRMHSFDGFEQHTPERREYGQLKNPYEFEDARRRSDPRGYAVPFGDDDYRLPRAATVVAPSPPQTHVKMAPAPARSAFEPVSRPGFDRAAPRYDYASEVQYPRGRYASPERYEGGYMTDNYTSSRRRQHSTDGRKQFAHERQSRSRDRHAFAPETRRADSVDSWQHIPTRYPSPELMPMPTQMQMHAPERHMTAPERHMSMSERHNPPMERQMSARERHFQHAAERQQAAPAPEPRRASSLDRRLADRFNPESRNTPAPVGYHTGAGAPIPPPPMTSIGVGGPAPHMGIMPLVPFNRGPHPVPPPLARAATHPAQPMGMVPAPPPAPAPIPTAGTPRRHTMDEDIYIPGRHPGGPTPDWFGPSGHGMAPHEWDPSGGSARAPHVRRRPPHAHREHNKFEAKPSMQAGLSGPGRGLHRVTEWVNYIEDGPPEQHPGPLVA
ncbi:hypothetical protein QBC38DRAFT_182086 [Podospora fimiseda]|uniref:RBR-type E3 ubiquitin transferase n=1 Tax=Podospora fimiseda TaxID=252190 RepID=A0AAN7H571_9PEZI|nr:hypothetical protein QBC38DRAFT_182086 [Podospora fimiseda]